MSVLTPELRQKILDYLPRYPSKQAVTLPALHLVQDQLRCVPLEAVREIADILDVPIGTVMSRLHRGRKALQKALFDFGMERGLVAAPVTESQGSS